MSTSKNISVWLPFEIHRCPIHEYSCGGIPEPRFDLPVFREAETAIHWMSQPANAWIHVRNYKPVAINWVDHTIEEAVNLGFKLPTEDLH